MSWVEVEAIRDLLTIDKGVLFILIRRQKVFEEDNEASQSVNTIYKVIGTDNFPQDGCALFTSCLVVFYKRKKFFFNFSFKSYFFYYYF